MDSHQSLRPGLYVVATPIGNLADLSPRALQVLAEAAVVAAEDTRVSRKLIQLAHGAAKMLSLTEHNVAARATELVEAARGGVVALVSDAGTPAVSDPGARLVEAMHAAAVPVFAVAGPSALAAAISVAGFEGNVLFLGFLPKQAGERRTLLLEATRRASVVVFFESPNRLGRTLGELAEALDDPEVAVCRELTKLHEETARGKASELAGRFAETRGECTVVLRSPVRTVTASEAEGAAYMAEMRRAGAWRSAAAGEAARRFGVLRESAYAHWDEA